MFSMNTKHCNYYQCLKKEKAKHPLFKFQEEEGPSCPSFKLKWPHLELCL